jgi:site-specific DNA recombinase
MTVTPSTAIVLARISDARGDDTHGVDGQVGDGLALAARIGWGTGPRETHVIVENDTSAFLRRKVTVPGHERPLLRTVRPGFRRALDMLWRGDADGLIAVDLDRACRDPRDLEDLIDVVESRTPRIPVTSVSGSLRLETDADIAMARVMVAIGNKSSRDTARRVASEREKMAGRGAWGGGPRPFGFEADGVTIRPDEAEILVKAADALLSGVTLRYIVLELRARAVPTAHGGKWIAKTLSETIRRPRTAGLMVHRGEVVGKAPWSAILPEETWRAVCAILTDPERRVSPGNVPRWLGSKIYLCGKCGDGATMIVSAVRARGGQYRCADYVHNARAAGPLDEYVSRAITSRLARADAIDLLVRPAAEAGGIEGLHKEAETLRELLDEQARLHARRLIDARQLAVGSAELRARLSAIESRLSQDAALDPLEGIAGKPDAARIWEGLDLGRRRAILRSLLKVTVNSTHTGRQPDGSYFDPKAIDLDFIRRGAAEG